MATICASSTRTEPAECVREVCQQLGDTKPTFVVYFVSPQLDTALVCAELGKRLGNVPALGCTTAGEISQGRMHKGALVLMAFDEDTIGFASVHRIEDPSNRGSLDAALVALEQAVGQPVATLDSERYVGLILHDGLGRAEEATMSALSQVTNVPFVGGSAGDDLAFQATQVFVNFRPYTGSSAFALVEPKRGYRVLKTQSFAALEHELVATQVDEEARKVLQFNGRPAVQEYAAKVGVEPEAASGSFTQHPLGLLLSNGEPFVRSPSGVDGPAMTFFAQIKEGMCLRVLQGTDMVERTRRDLQATLEEMPSVSGLINFHCILRTLQLEAENRTEDYGKIFESVPTVGFSTYGESYIGHINQTSTMIAFC